MIVITYDEKRGTAYRDGECDAVANEWTTIANSNQRQTFLVATENIINRLRVLIARGDIEPSSIIFSYYDYGVGGANPPSGSPIALYTLRHDARGRIENWPSGFANYNERQIEDLLEW